MSLNIYLVQATDSALVTPDVDILKRFIEFNAPRHGISFVSEPEQAEIIVLFEKFSFKQKQYRQQLVDSPLLKKYCHKIFTVNYDDVGQGFLPGCYTSLRRNNYDCMIHRACAYPKSYNNHTNLDAPELTYSGTPRLLFSFRGSINTHPVRIQLAAALQYFESGSVTNVDQAFHTHSEQQQKSYVEEILNSKFVLCPRGYSPSTYRMYEVMKLARCPVVISDAWVPPNNIDWDACSIRIAEKDIAKIPQILAAREHSAEGMGRKALQIWNTHFSDEAKNRAYLDMILELHSTRPQNGRSLEEMDKRWKSLPFYWNNNWALPQRILRKVLNVVTPTSS